MNNVFWVNQNCICLSSSKDQIRTLVTGGQVVQPSREAHLEFLLALIPFFQYYSSSQIVCYSIGF